MNEVKSNLRWPGGKSKMIKILDGFVPENVNKYCDIFVGGGKYVVAYYPKI